MDEALKNKLLFLADKYETREFINSDPSQFLYWYPKKQIVDVECAAFIAAMLSFGNRKQFIEKIRWILELADQTKGTVSAWLLHECPQFPQGEKKFYRFYSYDDMKLFFSEISSLLKKEKSLGCYFKNLFYNKNRDSLDCFLNEIISDAFPFSKIVPKGKTSANKRIHMFLRWMVRQNSPVDLGIWDWFSPSLLKIPIDTHVLQESVKLGLLSTDDKPSKKTVIKLTSLMNEIFPGDPCRADYSLFGLGVDYPDKS